MATPSKSGGSGASATPSGGRGKGVGRGGFMDFGERKDPSNKGQKVKLIVVVLIGSLLILSFIFLIQEVPEGTLFISWCNICN